MAATIPISKRSLERPATRAIGGRRKPREAHGDENQKSMMGGAVKQLGGREREAKGTSMPLRIPSVSERDGFRKRNMSALGLGCVKTPRQKH